jgi:hypothetical protein
MIPPRPQQMNKSPMPGPGQASRRRLLLKGLKFSLLAPVFFAKSQFVPWWKSLRSGRLLDHVGGPATPRERTGLALVAPYYGNATLLRSFVDHHRRLGVGEFVLLDLSNKADLHREISCESGVAIWRPSKKWDAVQVQHWLNYLRGRYARGRWCLSLEISDLFVFDRCEKRQIGDFTDFLETEGRNHLYALVVEMYGAEPAAALEIEPGDDLLDKLPYFDPMGYVTAPNPGPHRNVIVRGGVQRRTLFSANPNRSPALNRIPLVKWDRFFAYCASTRLLMPARLNNPHSAWHSSPTACLLRFALLDSDENLTTAVQIEAEVGIRDGGGRLFAGVPALRKLALKQDFSARYTGTESLIDCGLLNRGQWF